MTTRRAGRPTERDRSEIVAAAITIADEHGLAAVSMRKVAGALGTGPASIYRHIATREELLDLMVDATAARYQFGPPSDNWLTDMVDLAEQTRAIVRQHPWLAEQMITRPSTGPHSLDLLEHVLRLLAAHPAPEGIKLEAFAVLNAVIATFCQQEASKADIAVPHIDPATYPRLAAALPPAAPDPAGRFRNVAAKVLRGMLD